jgi:LPXTG-site transpeptidase (sortase) family protein
MEYFRTWKHRREKKYQIIYKRGPSTLALMFAGMALSLWGIFVFLSSFPIFLYLFYTIAPGTSDSLSEALSQTSVASAIAAPTPTAPITPDPKPVIARDTSLPEGSFLAIPTIGVDTTIWEASSTEYEEALRQGVWRVPEFATPEESDGRPIILAAHRFGYIDWTQAYREKNSFYNLSEVKVGETVTITWNQHRYSYRVTKLEEGTEITDYSSDLILYTCKFLVSPQRIFVHAELMP